MKTANVNETKDLNYKNGYVECKCGWRNELGDGFNGYHIDSCLKCDFSLYQHRQSKVVTGSPKGANLTVKVGSFLYFVLSNGIYVQYRASVVRTYHNLTERQADKI